MQKLILYLLFLQKDIIVINKLPNSTLLRSRHEEVVPEREAVEGWFLSGVVPEREAVEGKQSKESSRRKAVEGKPVINNLSST